MDYPAPGDNYDSDDDRGRGMNPLKCDGGPFQYTDDDTDSSESPARRPQPYEHHKSPSKPTHLAQARIGKGRKYLYPKIDTIQELGPEQVRWFYKEISDKQWKPFISYDSLRIECKYRQKLIAVQQHSDIPEYETNKEEQEDKITVRGGLFDVNVEKMSLCPIYWTGGEISAQIQRGAWFFDNTWQPLEDEFADRIEEEQLAKFKGEKIQEDSVILGKRERPVLHNVKFQEFHVDWNSPNEVYLFWETASSRFVRSIKSRFGFQKSGIRLRRGYNEEAQGEDKPADISHLVFVVHGMGQKMEAGKIVRSCSELRETASKIVSQFFPDLDYKGQRAEFLPVEWRTSLKLDGDIVESITPLKMQSIRNFLNSSAMDILYYTSPLYRSEITHGLQTEINRLYSMFCDRHPYFEPHGGKVSIIAHSLGSVITYDIITGWNPIQLYDQYVAQVIEETSQETEGAAELISQLEVARKKVSDLEGKLLDLSTKQHLKTPTLKFRLENFFCLGSPLAVFLALRGKRPGGPGEQGHLLPKQLCSRLFNVFHPYDPVAYRLEPLILKHYSTILPLIIQKHDDPNKGSYTDMKAKAWNKQKELKSISEERKLSDPLASVKIPKLEPEPETQEESRGLSSFIPGRKTLSSAFAKLSRKSASVSSQDSETDYPELCVKQYQPVDLKDVKQYQSVDLKDVKQESELGSSSDSIEKTGSV